MALHDEIRREITAGRIPRRFKTSDLKKIPGNTAGHYKVGDREYSKNAINTIPRNHSIRPDGTRPGDYVRKHRKPAFLWFGKGEFELLSEHENNIEDSGPEGEGFDVAAGASKETLIRGTAQGMPPYRLPVKVDSSLLLRIAEREPDPAAIIVSYLATQPFQAYYRRKPEGQPRCGWAARLESYFWPEPDCTWPRACAFVSELSSQVHCAIETLRASSGNATAARELMDAFKEICSWGHVKLPESDQGHLATEVLLAMKELEGGKKPPPTCRLNSAWTKLYAFALPDTCVIYDSRVAAALTSILDPAMEMFSDLPSWQPYLNLETISGRGGSRPRDLKWKWRNGYGIWASQMAANLLCRKVVDKLKARPDCHKIADSTPWTLREVEAVLFMEGY